MITPSEFVQQYAPWSMSKAECAAQCPRKFYILHILKPKKKQPMNSDALVGKAVHSLLEYTLKDLELAKAWDRVQSEYTLTTVEIERIIEMRPYIENFLLKFKNWCAHHGVKEYFTERKFAVNKTGNPVEFFSKDAFFRGVVDLTAFMSSQPHVAILDHKTGRQRDIRYYSHQFDSYMLLIKAAFPHVTGAINALNFVQDDQVVFSPFQELGTLESLMDKIVGYLNVSTSKTENFVERRESALCSWCDAEVICKESGIALPGTDSENAQG